MNAAHASSRPKATPSDVYLDLALFVLQQRLPLPIGIHHTALCLLPTPADLFTEDTRDTNDQAEEEEHAHDDECKYPLQGEDLDRKLGDSES